MQKFTQRDVERATRGAIKAGVTIDRIEIRPDGAIVVIAAGAEPQSVSALDDELEKWRRSNGAY